MQKQGKCMTYEFALFALPYEYDALEPHIDTLTMHLHHDRHLKTYTDKLNAALAPFPELHNRTLEWLLCNPDVLPPAIRTAVRNNGGGVYNHIYYFCSMTPHATETPPMPDCALGIKIDRSFGSWEAFKKQFKASALDLFGSGYLWLVTSRRGQLKILPTYNQDTPIVKGFCPLFCIDLWEHAYYLKHYNDRASYIDDWFAVFNGTFAERNYEHCIQ
ncbi:MAG: superoxide dismutase [Oscillospiraceae bacterium]|nr:superoxide dismutase [Oscillospiraceae bacterium]